MCETADMLTNPIAIGFIVRAPPQPELTIAIPIILWEHQASDGLLIIALASDRRAGRRRRESAGRRDLLPGGPE